MAEDPEGTPPRSHGRSGSRCRVRIDAGRLVVSLDGQDRLVLPVDVDADAARRLRSSSR